MTTECCPLCLSTQITEYLNADPLGRQHLICTNCDLSFVSKHFHLCPEEEKQIYDQHENSPEDQGYRNFLSKLANPMIKLLSQNTLPESSPIEGLDFGSGPGPTLFKIFEENGYHCSNFDKFYANNESLLDNAYDFISCTEVIEHLDRPAEVFKFFFQHLKENGVLGLMTKLRYEGQPYEQWHYIKDPTHITFYSEKTMEHIAALYRANLTIIKPDVIIFELNDR